jgi:acetolactate synthase-1/3 small subunit
MKEKRHVIAMLVEDQPGVLTRIAGMFARRGFNIDTITVGKTTKPGISKMVITVIGDDATLEQVEKQINKLVDTIKVMEMLQSNSVIRELCLVKVAIPNKKAKEEILRYTKIYKTKIVDITQKSVTAQLIGVPAKIDAFIDLMKQFGIKEISRTGVTAISRG